jgi:8-oxo-dGTP pyrophosphatase MutT (NUDIX family)
VLLDEDLRTRLTTNLAAFTPRLHPPGPGGGSAAAVAVALVPDEDGHASLVLLLRGDVGSHRGQYGLPGGRLDAGETPIAAARRELAEEVGVADGDVLGRLDDVVTRSGFVIGPVVLWCLDAAPRITSPAEVAELHLVGLDRLAAPGAVHHTTIGATGRPSVQVDVGFTTVFAPTGAILHQFRAVCLLGDPDVRVDDLDSPPFTWR